MAPGRDRRHGAHIREATYIACTSSVPAGTSGCDRTVRSPDPGVDEIGQLLGRPVARLAVPGELREHMRQVGIVDVREMPLPAAAFVMTEPP